MMPQRGSRGPSPAESIGWAGADGALPGSGDAARDRGSSVAEFSLVVVMLMLIFLGLISVGLWAYTRVLLTSAAAAAARYVANADVSDAGAADKVRQELGAGIVASTGATLVCHADQQGLLVGVSCTMQTPGLVGFLDGVLPDITVTGHSMKEAVK